MKFKDIKNFIQGNYNHLLDEFNLLDDKSKELANKRIKICQQCPHLKNNKCSLCSCSYPNYTFSKDKVCKDGRW